MTRHAVWWKQAITDDTNRVIEPSFLCVIFAVFLVMPTVILILSGVAVLDVVMNKHEASIGGLGGGIAAVIASVGTFVGAMAIVLNQDRKPQNPGITTTTTSATSATTNTVATPLPEALVK